MHVFHQPLAELEAMEVDELMEWADDAAALVKAIYGSK